MPGVDTNVPLLVPVNQGDTVTVNNTGSQTVFYQAMSVGGTISQTVSDGSIPPFGSLSFIASTRLLAAAGGAQVDLGYNL